MNYLVGGAAIQEPSVITPMRMNRRLPHLIFFPLFVLLGWGVSLSSARARQNESNADRVRQGIRVRDREGEWDHASLCSWRQGACRHP